MHFLKLLVQVILAPSNGWLDIEREGSDAKWAFASGFLPLTIATALSTFMGKVYQHDLLWSVMVQKSIVVFAAFFAGLYIGEFFFSMFFLPDIETSLDTRRIRLFLVYSLSVMALMSTIINCIPFSPVLILLPLYSIVVMRKGSRFLKVLPSRIGHFMMLSIFGVFVPPFLIIFLFNLLIG